MFYFYSSTRSFRNVTFDLLIKMERGENSFLPRLNLPLKIIWDGWHVLGCKDLISEVALQRMLIEYMVFLCSKVVHDHLRRVIFDVLQELWKWGKPAFFCNWICRLQFGIVLIFCCLKITTLSHKFCVIWISKVDMFGKLCFSGFTMNQLACVLLYTVYCYTLKRKEKTLIWPEQTLNQRQQFLAELKCNRHFSLGTPKCPIIITFADRSVCFS